MATAVEEIASALDTLRRGEKQGKSGWVASANFRLKNLERDCLQPGGQIECVELSGKSEPDKIKIAATFRHLNDNGDTIRRTDHWIVVTPTFVCGPVDVRLGGSPLDYRGRTDLNDGWEEILTCSIRQCLLQKVKGER
jgi:hypothetical protein